MASSVTGRHQVYLQRVRQSAHDAAGCNRRYTRLLLLKPSQGRFQAGQYSTQQTPRDVDVDQRFGDEPRTVIRTSLIDRPLMSLLATVTDRAHYLNTEVGHNV